MTRKIHSKGVSLNNNSVELLLCEMAKKYHTAGAVVKVMIIGIDSPSSYFA